MNAVEIEEAVAELANAPFNPNEFPFAFLSAFGNKETTIKRLRSGSSNASDVENGVLQRNNIHIAVCAADQVGATLAALRASPKTAFAKAKFILATDGIALEAEDLNSGETIACNYINFADHFAFFLPLAGISAVRQIKNNPIDVKATGRLNKLYIELLKDNPEWATDARRHEMNQLMARLIFCFFAEDTGIFLNHLFSQTVVQMSDSQSGNTHEVIVELFRAMDTKPEDRKALGIRPWADAFPYVNGNLFSGATDCPRISRIARSYLLRAAELDWQEINPDIFGSMIQAVADEEERGELGMHYTSVPNILKVLNPLFLDDLRAQLDESGDSVRKLRNLRKRLSTIRVFDPACGSGNFIVIAYIQMREIEAEIVRRLGDNPRSWIPLSNFYGIEIRDFAAEIARLALLIAEFQCDARLISQQEAKLNVLPLKQTGRIVTDNALRIDWLDVCPPVNSLEPSFATDVVPGAHPQVEDTQPKAVETYICGNPPYKGSQTQSEDQKQDLEQLFGKQTESWRQLDYVAGWFIKACEYGLKVKAATAFVSTNSICQGRIVPILWPLILATGHRITFAHTSFKWANLAANNAGVTVVVIGLAVVRNGKTRLFESDERGGKLSREVDNINPYLIAGPDVIVQKRSRPQAGLTKMDFGNMPADGGGLLMNPSELRELELPREIRSKLVKKALGSAELIRGIERYCLWIDNSNLPVALQFPEIKRRIESVRQMRSASKDSGTRALAETPHQFREMKVGLRHTLAIPSVSSENRDFLPVSLLDKDSIITNLAFGLYDAPLWNLAIIASRIHLVWVATVCGKLKTDFRYSNTLGWNTFPVPQLTEKNKADLTRCASEILLAREAHYPASIADLYTPEAMPDELRQAHERNDETLERIYIGRRFRNDTERLEKLFDLYTKMITDNPRKKAAA